MTIKFEVADQRLLSASEGRVAVLTEEKGPVFRVSFPDQPARGGSFSLVTKDYSYIEPGLGEPGAHRQIVFPTLLIDESMNSRYGGKRVLTSAPVPSNTFIENRLELELFFNGLAYDYAGTWLSHLKKCGVVDGVYMLAKRWRDAEGLSKNLYLDGDFQDLLSRRSRAEVERIVQTSPFVSGNKEKYASWVEQGRPL